MTTDVDTGVGERVFALPDLGEGLIDAEIVEWLVAVGDAVEVDQPVASVLSEKATVELPSPFAGRVVCCHGAVGDRVAVAAPLVTIAVASAPSNGTAPGSGQVLVGYGTTDAATGRARRRRHTAVVAGPSAASASAVPVIPAVGHIVTTPPIRRLAREHGVDLATLTGSGPGGRITRQDVEAAVRAAGLRRRSFACVTDIHAYGGYR